MLHVKSFHAVKLIRKRIMLNSRDIPRRLMPVFVLACLAAVLCAAPVRADIAPPQPPLGADLVPGLENTQVRMQAETVRIELPSSSPSDNWQASVSATFKMRNLGSSAESMPVRFPMFMTEEYAGLQAGCPYPDTNYPAIQDFRALVEDVPAEVKIIPAALDHFENGTTTTVQKPCWAEFQVTFPAGQDLKIEVRYRIQGQLFGHGETNYLGFPYILTTGAGWQGSIGSADISLVLPYPASDLNVYDISKGGQIQDGEVRWHFEDFEPDLNTRAWVINPRIWQAIQKDSQTVQDNPKDGETWGFLGKSYKQVFLFDRGFRLQPGGAELFNRGRAAYQQAVELLPKDADWHYGYGDLLCQTALWNGFGAQDWLPPTPDLLRDCMLQLQQALQINPTHAKTRELLAMMSSMDGNGLIDLSGPQPDFLILTPGNYHTPTSWPSSTPAPAPSNTAGPLPSSTATLAPSATPRASSTPADSPTSPPPPTSPTPASARNPILPFCGALVLPLLLVLLIRPPGSRR